MPTLASQQALSGLRDLSMLKWYVIPLLAIVFYIYTSEMKKARQTGCWDVANCYNQRIGISEHHPILDIL